MCEYLKRMSPQGAPTDDIRLWSGLAHSVVEHTGPGPFGMDGSVYLWLHERSVTQLLDMCDELDAKFSDLMLENAKLRELVRDVYALNWNGFDCTECPWFDECRTEGGCPWLGILHDHMRELGVNAE